ncbi:MAG: hypothetical protein U9P71_04460 [Campylobacterota bacterium]|nr:hypothetical protein [Campylobacterota bacterium]
MDFTQPVENIHVVVTIAVIFAIVAVGILFVRREKKRKEAI